MIEREHILEVGYCQVPFGMTEIQRADYTRVASRVIELAVADEQIHDALTFSLLPDFEGRINPTLFTVSGAMNSADDKMWLHAGYQTREFANTRIPERNQPAELRALWSLLRAMLHEVEQTYVTVFKALGARALTEAVFHPDYNKRVVLIRTVKYHDALSGPVGSEMVSGHADQSVATLHPYETHGGWFHATPYPQDLMLHENTDDRVAKVATMRSGLKPITYDHEREAVFFLGVGARNLPAELRVGVEGLPGAYHAGFKPEAEAQITSVYANDISNVDRVATIVLAHPNTDILTSGEHEIASVPQCRPAYTRSV